MTTVVLTGHKLIYDLGTMGVASSQDVTISLFYEGDLSTLSYAYIGGPAVNLLPRISLSVTSNQQVLSDGGSILGYTSTLGQVNWSEAGQPRSTIIMNLVSPDLVTNYTFLIGGSFADYSDPATISALLGSATGVTVPGGVFAPGANIFDTLTAPDSLGAFTVTEDDTYTNGVGNVSVMGGTGRDSYTDTSGFDLLNYQSLDAQISVSLLNGIIKKGANGRDTVSGFEDIVGTDYNDVIAGEDSLGGNYLYGMLGNDVIRGFGGEDFLDGGDGNDKIFGGDDNDILLGQLGNDLLLGNNGDDDLTGGDGVDVLKGGGDNDILDGGNDNDRLYGNRGNDILDGADGDDRLYGGSGADQLNGGTGDDALRGEAGQDEISGGAGDDALYGGDSADTFVFLDNGLMGRDLIKDWEAGKDQLDLSDFAFADFAAVQAFATDQGPNLKLDFGDAPGGIKQIILIENYSYAQFNVDDVMLLA